MNERMEIRCWKENATLTFIRICTDRNQKQKLDWLMVSEVLWFYLIKNRQLMFFFVLFWFLFDLIRDIYALTQWRWFRLHFCYCYTKTSEDKAKKAIFLGHIFENVGGVLIFVEKIYKGKTKYVSIFWWQLESVVLLSKFA